MRVPSPSPGVKFLAWLTVRVLSIPFVLGLALHHGSRRFGVELPAWVSAPLAASSLPMYIAYRVLRKNARQRREAAAMGARFAPVVKGKWPGSIDLIGMMVYNRKFGYPGDGLLELFEELDSPVINVRVLWMDALFTVWPDHIKQILAGDFSNYEKGKRFQYGMESVLGTGVFNSDGEMWKFHRAMTRPFFSRDKVSHFDIFDHHADAVIAIMKERMRGGYSIDFQDIIGRFTMDSATEFLFGCCVDSLKANIPYAPDVLFPPPQSRGEQAERANKFIEAFNEAMQAIAEREILGYIWPLYEIFRDTTAEPMKIVSAFLDPIIRSAVEKKQTAGALAAEKTGEIEAETLLDELLQSTSDPKVLKDETLNILLAGRDTTMHVTTMVIYFLSMYPDVCTRLREEILTHVGPTRRPTYNDIKDMKYLRAVINESMRLYPSVPFNVRDCINATTWPSPDPNDKPIYVPASTKVPYAVFFMHRRRDLWGPDAEEFSPERFLDERLKKYLLNNAFQFLPFNAGPRICLGQQFAYNEMSFMLIRLLQSFSSFELDEAAFAPEARPPKEWANFPGRKGIDKFRPKLHLTMYTSDGMWIKIKEAPNLEEA
ncbi:cytochrome P450 [Mycena maculata]|uniref:Cytochrome P450 n=1 Tax=Mycena maculata TaxID=230809 RepID=A0AAD7I744_9AGAR|nr:cytochrome P450 [Mycena maculata]